MQKANTVYLAGKITGDTNYRRKFGKAAQRLKARGCTVLNPAMLPDGFTYAAYIRISAAMLDECAAVCFLPDWQNSKGAKAEYRRAKSNGQHISFYEEWLQKGGERR